MRAPQPRRFTSEVGGLGSFPEYPPRIVLDREVRQGREVFRLDPPIRYDAVLPGHDELVGIVVPRPGSDFRTDLTSVPDWFTWLVPKSGQHLPAALIHDGLVPESGGEPDYETVPPGIEIDRIDADRVFRDAMFDTFVGRIRCYLVWAAVSVASLWLGPRPRARWPPALLWYFRVVIALTFLLIGYLGVSATLDLAGRSGTFFRDLPWIPEDDGLLVPVLGGLAGAIAIPLVVGVAWGHYYRVGVIAQVAVAVLFHVTLAVALVAVAYQVAEWLTEQAPEAARKIMIVAVIASVVAFLMLVT